MANIDKNPIEKVRDLLGVSEELTVGELYDKLFEYRNSQHPDRFQDNDAKKIAEEKFKEAGNLLNNLNRDIELQLVNRPPSEIIPFQKIYDNIQLKQTIVKFQDEIQSLKDEISLIEYQNKDLKKEIKTIRNEKLKEKMDDLIKLYKPTKKGLFSNGIILILTLLGGILTKIESIGLFILKYSPIPENIINNILFIILLFIPLRMLYQYLKQDIIEKISQLIVTPPILKLFLDELERLNKKDNFNELDVYNFISRINFPKNSKIRWVISNIFNTKSYKVINGLKDIFIYNLLSKQLIEISRADKLDRTFNIIKGYYHFDFSVPDNNSDDF